MTYKILIILHSLGAAIWTGGHLVLALGILPRALKQRDVAAIREFEERFERIGIPALIVQVLTGLSLAYNAVPNLERWFSFESPFATTIALKLIFLGTTMLLALDARLRIIPRLDESRLNSLAWHIIPVTILSVLFVIVGATARVGGVLGF